MPKIQITQPAKSDIQQSFDWWSENRSPAQATEWYERIHHAIATLERMPERCPLVPEEGLSQNGGANFYLVSGSVQPIALSSITRVTQTHLRFSAYGVTLRTAFRAIAGTNISYLRRRFADSVEAETCGYRRLLGV